MYTLHSDQTCGITLGMLFVHIRAALDIQTAVQGKYLPMSQRDGFTAFKTFFPHPFRIWGTSASSSPGIFLSAKTVSACISICPTCYLVLRIISIHSFATGIG